MKHLKTYEKNNNNPQIGDYVICSSISGGHKLNNFLSQNIGQYIEENNPSQSKVSSLWAYIIKYENIPNSLISANFNGKNYRYVTRNEIIMWSPNKEDLETYIDQNKYNL
jgi:hypothetical protein